VGDPEDPFEGELDPDEDLGADDAEEAYERQLAHRIFRSATRESRWFVAREDGSFEVQLTDTRRKLLGRIASDLRDLLLTGDDALRRLYPTAYPDDPALNAEFAAFAHDQLLMARLEALDVVEATIDAPTLTTQQLNAWMQATNEARLVLGTRLDVTEDDDGDDDPDDPDAPARALYHYLGILVDDIVDALHGQLPPPSQPDD
jgi:hypothetical protein